MKKNYILLAGMLAFISCSQSDANLNDASLISFNNFEAVEGWGPMQPTVTKEKAHSGKYAIKVDAAHEFSYGFDKTIGQITNKKPKALNLEAWAYVPGKDTGKASLILQITKPSSGQQVKWEGIDVVNNQDFKEWTKISKTIKLPDNVEVSDRLQVYLWRGGATEPVYLDDLKISTSEE